MRGSIRSKGPGVYEMRVYVGKVDGVSQYRSRLFRGPKKEADEALRAFVVEAEAAREENRQLETDRRKKGPTVADAAEGWWRSDGRHLEHPGTARVILDTYILPTLGPVALRRLRGRVEVPERGAVCLTDYYEGLATKEGKPLAASSVARVHGILRLVLGYAVRVGWLERNVAAESRRPRMERRPSTVPDAAALAKLMGRVRKSHPSLHAWLCLVASGARPVEVHALRWSDVDWAKGHLRLRADGVVVAADGQAELRTGETRKRRLRVIALDSYTVAALEHWRRQAEGLATADGFLFTRDGGAPRYPTWARQAFKRAVKLARKDGLALPEGFRPYDLRHFLGSQAIAAGMGVADVADRMGNSPVTVHRAYVHPVKDGDKRIADLMGELWGSVSPSDGAEAVPSASPRSAG